jgi:hypothetical protein
LLQRDAGKPLNELVHLRAILEVLEQRGNRHACATEHPGSADQFGVPLDSEAGGPVDHKANVSIATSWWLTLKLSHGPRARRVDVLRTIPTRRGRLDKCWVLENLIPLAPRVHRLVRASRRRATSRYLLTGSAPCGNRRWRATPRLRRRHISRWPLVLDAESYPPVSRPRRSALVA